MADVEKTGAVFKVLAAKEPVTWNKLSFWTKAEDVQFETTDRLPDVQNTVQHRLENIYGISDDSFIVDNGICASTYLVNYIASEKVSLTLNKDAWSASPQHHQNGNDYYYQDKEADKVILNNPILYLLTTTSTLPTDDEKDVFSGIEMEIIGRTTMRFYSQDKPDFTIRVGVKGVIYSGTDNLPVG